MIRPASTYRIQFRGDMTLSRAAELAPYFAALGVSHLYASPIFTATPGSTHGYDVADFNEIDPVIGGMEGFERLSHALRDHGLGLILDFVPNHMGASPFNPWWRNVLEWGADSDYREHFDIDWSAPKLVAPVLGQPYGQALRDGQFGLELDGAGGLAWTYYDLRLPLTPPSYARVLARIEQEPFPELARRFAVARTETVAPAKTELAELANEPAVRPQIDAAIASIAADQSALHDLHEAQIWRLSYWRAAREGLTYRRFFEIAELVGVRVERPRVFDDAHRLLRELIAKDQVHGVRLDHIDGLADPKSYLLRLQEAIGDGAEPFYLLVEKILGPGEVLRPSWPVAGTTGYEFMQALAGLFIDPASEAAMTTAYESFLGASVDYRTMVVDTKRRILTRNLAGELEFLRDLAKGLAERDPATRDYGPDSLRRAILEFAAALPLYRTYVNVEGADETDLAVIAAAVETVKAAREVEDEGAIEFIARLLRLDFPDPELQGLALVFAARFQQTTGPVMAKALEDTVFYRYNRLIALNEVGGEPDHYGASTEAFHRAMQERLDQQPFGFSATATHDTKRGEDARARLYGISEIADEWRDAVAEWSASLAGLRAEIDGARVPEPEFEWLFYQSLAGSWPAELTPDDEGGLNGLADRLEAYMLKVVREAKLRTSWTAPAGEYEAAVKSFVRGALARRDFLDDFRRRCAKLWLAGAVTSLSQLAIKIGAPGVPDIYQGTEFWDLSLVDPDNRRPFEFKSRQAAVDELDAAPPDALLREWVSAKPKMRLMKAGLTFRRDHPELFGEAEYIPLETAGEQADRLVAFARRSGARWLIVAATRRPLGLVGDDVPLVPSAAWGDTRIVLPREAASVWFRDVMFAGGALGGSEIEARSALGRFPVALLYGTGEG